MGMLENGAVLPHGLLSEADVGVMAGFNKSYKNFPLRIGVVVDTYPVSDEKNRGNLTTEYDVLVIEQNEDKGSTPILYRNCMSAEGLGSIADFFERTLRKKKKKTTRGDSTNLKGQDGAVVLVLCLDGMSDKGIIISALTNPDRPTNLVDDQPFLIGEYNGVRIIVNTDGSTSLSFKGATNNDGSPVDASQGTTKIAIEKDGTVQINHDAITMRLARDGTTTLNAKKDINLITATNLNVTATANVVVKCVEADVTASGKIVMKGSEIDLNNPVSGITTENSHQGVIDFITGVPVQASTTVKSDV